MFRMYLLILVATLAITFSKSENLHEKFLLKDGKRDSCYQKKTIREAAECLLDVMEGFIIQGYSDKFFTMSCPYIANHMARDKCEQCPWSKIDVEKIDPQKMEDLFNASEDEYYRLFADPGENCRLFTHIYNTFDFYESWFWLVSIFSVFIGLVVTAHSTNNAFFGIKTKYERPSFLQQSISEPIYLGVLFFFFRLGFLSANTVTTFLYLCESEKSASISLTVMNAAYISLLVLSISRCLHLPLKASKDGSTSLLDSINQKHRKFVLHIPYAVLILVTIFNYLEVVTPFKVWEGNVCIAGYKNYRMGFVQYSKVILEFATVIVFALGTRLNSSIRYGILLLCGIYSVVLFGLMFSPKWYIPLDTSMLISNVFDSDIATHFLEIFHVLLLVLLGVFEFYILKIKNNKQNSAE